MSFSRFDLSISETDWKALDARFKIVDEDAWLASRYTSKCARQHLALIYIFKHELVLIGLRANEAVARQMRLAWWRSQIADLAHQDIEKFPAPSGIWACKILIDCGFAEALQQLIDAYEASYLDMSGEENPDWLAIILAANMTGLELNPEWSTAIDTLYTLRRAKSEAAHLDAISTKDVRHRSGMRLMPSHRPFLAHIRLTPRYYAGLSGKMEITPFQKRLSIFLAVLTGKV